MQNPSLKAFIRRAQVLSLYRSVWRKTKPLEATQRMEIRQHARQSFEATRHVSDLQQVSYLITEGKRQIEWVETSINMAR